MLVSSGIGSNYSRRILGKSEGRLIKALACVAFGAALLALAVSTLLGPLVWLPFGAESRDDGRAHRPARIRHGNAVPDGPAASGSMARAVGSLGVVAERRVERARVGRRAGVRDLSRTGADDDHGRPFLSGGPRRSSPAPAPARRPRRNPAPAASCSRSRPEPRLSDPDQDYPRTPPRCASSRARTRTPRSRLLCGGPGRSIARVSPPAGTSAGWRSAPKLPFP